MNNIHTWTENRQWFDRYSIPHAAVGMVFQASGIPPWLAIGGHAAFEASEDRLKELVKPIWPEERPDGWQNHVGDMVSFTGGYYAAKELRETEAGKVILTGVVALAAGIWMWNLVQRHSWLRSPAGT